MCFKCIECKSSFLYKSNLYRHLISNHEINPFKCEYCEETYNKKSDLKIHIKTKHADVMLKCEHCDFVTISKHNLKRHSRVKHETTPFKCDHCENTYNRKMDLKRHMKREHKEKTLKCEQCDFTTNKKYHMTRHFKEKHTDQLINCSKCIYKSKSKENLRQHFKRKHTIKNCGKCSFNTYKMAEMKKHEKTHESDDIGIESTFENMYRKKWNVKDLNEPWSINDPWSSLSYYKQKIRDTLLDYILENGSVEWFIAMTVKNNLYHNGKLIQKAAPTYTGKKYIVDDISNFDEHYEISTSIIANKIIESIMNNRRWEVDKVLYVYVQIKHNLFEASENDDVGEDAVDNVDVVEKEANYNQDVNERDRVDVPDVFEKGE